MSKTLVVLCCSMLLVSASAFAQTKRTTKAAPAPVEKRKPLPQRVQESMIPEGNYGMAGCGLGSIVMKKNSMFDQVLAATLNGTGVQTFGITSGTSKCATDDSQKSAALFMTVNREVLAKDISRGSGEALSNFSEIVGCSNSQLLGTKLQQNFNAIFPNEKSSAEESNRAIFDIIRNDSELSKSCAVSA